MISATGTGMLRTGIEGTQVLRLVSVKERVKHLFKFSQSKCCAFAMAPKNTVIEDYEVAARCHVPEWPMHLSKYRLDGAPVDSLPIFFSSCGRRINE